MNELRRIDTLDNGNGLLFYPHGGHLFYFEAVSRDSIRLHTVDVLENQERVYDEWTSFENLPAPVRRAISTSSYRMRSTASTLAEAM